MTEHSGRPHWSERARFDEAYKHNDLFRPGPQGNLNACVGTNGGPYNLQDYADGYFRAGARLTSTIMADPTWLDVVVYPLVFLHRQALELGLKHLATTLPRLWDEEPRLKLTHPLLGLWSDVRPYIERHEMFAPSESVPPIDALLRDFSEIDPTGEAFRFPSARDQSMFLQRTSHINIVIFGEAMDFAAATFEFWFITAQTLLLRKEQGDQDAG